MRMGWRGTRILNDSKSDASDRGPGDLLFATRSYLIVGGLLSIVRDVVLFSAFAPWSAFAADSGDPGRQFIFFYLNAATAGVLVVAIFSVVVKKLAAAARVTWAIFAALAFAVIATRLVMGI